MHDVSDDPHLATPHAPERTRTQHGGLSAPPASLPPDDAVSSSSQGRSLPATRPPATYVPVRRWVVEHASELRLLRQDLRDQLLASTHDGTSGTIDSVVLVTSELATNALAHGHSAAQVQLLLDDRSALVIVSDTDATHAPFVAQGREPGEGGFGLQIAQRLSVDVGWWSDASGKHVWAAFAPPA